MDRRILVIDDHDHTRNLIVELLKKPGRELEGARDGSEALERLAENNYSLAITDIRLPEIDGLDMMREIRRKRIPVTVIVVTGYASIDTAVEAMKLGAYDYLVKPLDPFRLEVLVEQALKDRTLQDEVEERRRVLRARYRFDNLVGRSSAMGRVFDLVARFAPWSCPILIQGESGAGKELVAQAIHHAGRSGRLVTVNCAALSDALFESELFGHERGAFTGAIQRKIGRFEMADGGTLFLDEIGELKPEMQAKLLRVLQNGQFERVGGTEPIRANARIVAATNRNLLEMVLRGEFREDLYFRLKGAAIELPPLRERPEDIPLLVEHFLRAFEEQGLPSKTFSRAALHRLSRHNWPGNVRELENLVTKGYYSSLETTIEEPDIADDVPDAGGEAPFSLDFDPNRPLVEITEELTEQIERAYLHLVLNKFKGRIQESADHCGLSRRSISEKLKRYQIDKAEFKSNSSRRRKLALKES